MPSGPPTRTGAPPDAPGAALLGARVRWTGRAEGDLRPPAPGFPAGPALDGLAGRPVSWVRQVHGSRVLVAGDQPVLGDEGDALVTASAGAALAVFTADCAPVALASPEGIVGAVHAGWTGVLAGVVGAAVDTMRALGATRVEAALGPCIRAGCYEFGRADLDRLVAALGPSVEGVTAAGRPALDLPAAVEAALAGAGATLVLDTGLCTACDAGRHFSHRARGDAERQAMVVWRDG